MKRQWNTICKRFDCSVCGNQWDIGEKHTCQVEHRKFYEWDVYWNSLTPKERDEWRNKFNNSIDYDKYEDVSKYAFENKSN
jgi:hypothetical protein